eukprot:GFUD01001208.1.p1 GENE.GFUD01001208.1~~GFUD01001208.1.p1  ORF type:complete len:106 (-),score=25.24 GFUD01001208.1:365-682(-)
MSQLVETKRQLAKTKDDSFEHCKAFQDFFCHWKEQDGRSRAEENKTEVSTAEVASAWEPFLPETPEDIQRNNITLEDMVIAIAPWQHTLEVQEAQQPNRLSSQEI